MPIESVPVCLGGKLHEYNESYEFDISKTGPFYYPGAPTAATTMDNNIVSVNNNSTNSAARRVSRTRASGSDYHGGSLGGEGERNIVQRADSIVTDSLSEYSTQSLHARGETPPNYRILTHYSSEDLCRLQTDALDKYHTVDPLGETIYHPQRHQRHHRFETPSKHHPLTSPASRMNDKHKRHTIGNLSPLMQAEQHTLYLQKDKPTECVSNSQGDPVGNACEKGVKAAKRRNVYLHYGVYVLAAMLLGLFAYLALQKGNLLLIAYTVVLPVIIGMLLYNW